MEMFIRLAVISIFVLMFIIVGRYVMRKRSSCQTHTFIASETAEESKIKRSWIISMWMFLSTQILWSVLPIIVLKIYDDHFEGFSELAYVALFSLIMRCVYAWMLYTTAYMKRGTVVLVCFIVLNIYALIKEIIEMYNLDFIITAFKLLIFLC